MSIQIVKKTYQARGQFNGGEILENKPLGFPREGGVLTPYSNLFYWAHAWSDSGSTIGLHPHQGFEIMSFVIEGSISHFDTAHNEWKDLEKGAAQIIRAGSGISHSERLNAGAHMFQVWFDPNLQEAISRAPSYDDYPHESFPINEENGIQTKTYKGGSSPLHMETPGISIEEKQLAVGSYRLPLKEDKIYSFYLIKGSVMVDDETLGQDDFFIVKESLNLTIEVKEAAQIFLISSPQKLNYTTYAETHR